MIKEAIAAPGTTSIPVHLLRKEYTIKDLRLRKRRQPQPSTQNDASLSSHQNIPPEAKLEPVSGTPRFLKVARKRIKEAKDPLESSFFYRRHQSRKEEMRDQSTN